jgi:dihydrofolate reductase
MTDSRSLISLVVAVSRNGVIGNSGKLPWRLPSDLKAFRALTMGAPVIMGRKTWDSLPRKPLPGRSSIVITRDRGFHAPGAITVHGVEQALSAARAGGPGEVFVIGGAEIFAAFLPFADRVYLTRVDADVTGDTYFPDLDLKVWKEVRRGNPTRSEGDSSVFATSVFERRLPPKELAAGES